MIARLFVFIGLVFFLFQSRCASTGINGFGLETEKGESVTCTPPDRNCLQRCEVITGKGRAFVFKKDFDCVPVGTAS